MIKNYKQFNESLDSNADIDTICKKYYIENYTINPDGSIDVEGNVNLEARELTKLPLKFNRVSGYFDCSSNQLRDLEGAPIEVEKHFICSDNNLRSLDGCPEYIGGSLNCRNNKLTSLRGCPKIIGGSFNCSGNELTSLVGCPERINGDFMCYKNELTSLVGCTRKISGQLLCSDNKLVDLSGFPTVDGYVSCLRNPISNILEQIPKNRLKEGIKLLNNMNVIQNGRPIQNKLDDVLDILKNMD